MRGVGIGIHGGAGVRLAGGGGLLPFGDSFDRADGALGNGWTGATWTIASGKAVNTPTLGAELLTNGGFGSDTWWTHGAEWAIASGVATLTALYHGTLTTGANNGVVGSFCRTQFDVVSVAGGFQLLINSGASLGISRTTTGTFVETYRVTNAKALYQIWGSVNPTTGSIDNVSVKTLTLATLFSAINSDTPNVDVSAAATLVAGTQAGVVINLDSVSSPANFVIGYHDGTNVKLEKCVAGVYTNLISTAVAYSAGAAVRVVKSGATTYQLWYGGTQRGADQSVSDAGIVNNTLHGMFSTYEGNSLDDFSVVGV